MHVQMLVKLVLSKGKYWKNLFFKKFFSDIKTVSVDIPLCQKHINCMQVEERRGKNSNKEQIFLTLKSPRKSSFYSGYCLLLVNLQRQCSFAVVVLIVKQSA